MDPFPPKPRGYRGRKLTPEQIREIRSADMSAYRAWYKLAHAYGVSRKTIIKIRKGLTYKDVT